MITEAVYCECFICGRTFEPPVEIAPPHTNSAGEKCRGAGERTYRSPAAPLFGIGPAAILRNVGDTIDELDEIALPLLRLLGQTSTEYDL